MESFKGKMTAIVQLEDFKVKVELELELDLELELGL